MNVRQFNQKYLERGAITFMVAGILFLCQPWIAFIHAWSVLVMLVGLIAFNVSVHIAPPEQKAKEDDAGPVSLSASVKEGHGHG